MNSNENQKQDIRRFKEQHPAFVFGLIVVMSYYLIHKLGCIAVFLTGFTLPLIFIAIHASLRLRNIKNKLINKGSEVLGIYKMTPIGLLLNKVGIGIEKVTSTGFLKAM